jgi:hypothetical protein
MNIKQSTLAAAVTAALALGVSNQAAAYVYGAAGLTIDNLSIVINPNGGNVTVNRFDFALSNLAALNGNTAASSATCGGTPGAGNNNCTQTLGSMDAKVVNAPGSAPTRTENQLSGGEFAFLGPNTFTGDFANADSWIVQAELVNLGSPTKTHNIAESLLNNATSAQATSTIQSITGLTITFTTTGGPADFSINFDADPDLYAAIFGDRGSAQASLTTVLKLEKDGGGGLVQWSPQGTTDNDCFAFGVTSCAELADTQDLNVSVGTTTNNTSSSSSWDPNALNMTHFGLQVKGLSAGTWSLTLTETKANRLARVPEPSVLALMGIGLLGLGMSARRNKKLA